MQEGEKFHPEYTNYLGKLEWIRFDSLPKPLRELLTEVAEPASYFWYGETREDHRCMARDIRAQIIYDSFKTNA